MSRYFLIYSIYILSISRALGQWIVEAPTLEFLTSQVLTQQSIISTQTSTLAQLEASESAMRKATGIVTGLGSVKKFISIVNSVSCSASDFGVNVLLAQQQYFWNCHLDDESNAIVNSLMAAIDVSNAALSAFSAEPADRITLIQESIEKYYEVELRMRSFNRYVDMKMSQIKASGFAREELLQINGLIKY